MANPLATILSAAMMLRFSLNRPSRPTASNAVKKVLAQGCAPPTSTKKAAPRSTPSRWVKPVKALA
jgi:3-isopropylmalate dehydrogenase